VPLQVSLCLALFSCYLTLKTVITN